MIRNFFSIIAVSSISIISVHAQNNSQAFQAKAIVSNQGSFTLDLRDLKITSLQAEQNINAALSLSETFTFKKTKEHTDKYGITHATYQQYYKDVPVYGGIALIHSKNEIVNDINGKVLMHIDNNFSVVPALAAGRAENIARSALSVIALINHYDPELTIYLNQNVPVLAYKTRIDGKTKDGRLMMYNVFIDAATGNIINKITLVARNDVEATAETKYSGTRAISTDQFSGGYRLKDSARKISTYDVSGLMPDGTGSDYYANPREVTNSSTTWGPKSYLMEMNVSAMSNSSMLNSIGLDLNNPGNNIPGNILHVVVLKQNNASYDTVYSNYRVEDIYGGTVSLPLINNDLFIPVEEGSNYLGLIIKDSISLSPEITPEGDTTIALDIIGSDTANAIKITINNAGIGNFNWTDVAGNTGNYNISLEKHPALDVHWGIEMTYDYYKNIFNYYSYDNNPNSVMKNYYNAIEAQGNAAALPAPYNSMVYGTGIDGYLNPVVALDVTGHEYSHLVTGNNANLDYQGESGALNESFSDMMGSAIEFYAKGSDANWTIGEDVGIAIPFFRSMSDPKAPAQFSIPLMPPQPDTYLGEYWANTSNMNDGDEGGVHTNSGVGNKWFYLLAAGGSGTNDNNYDYSIPGLGIDKAEAIAFTGFTEYLTATAQYIDAYNATLDAAADLYGNTSTEYNTVKAAWKAVGIPQGDDPSGVSNNNLIAKNIRLYPNPNNGDFYIQSTLNYDVNAGIYDISGKEVMPLQIHEGINKIHTQNLFKGIYVVKFSSVAGVAYTQKMVLN